MARIYFQNPMVVNFPADKDGKYPNGFTVQYRAGWNEIDDSLVKLHPVLAKMVPEDATIRNREQTLIDAEVAHAKKIADADKELADIRAKILMEDSDQRQKMSEEWAQRRDEALSKGLPFVEPHPVPEQAILDARTGGTFAAVTPRDMQSEIMDTPTTGRERQAAQRNMPLTGDGGSAVSSTAADPVQNTNTGSATTQTYNKSQSEADQSEADQSDSAKGRFASRRTGNDADTSKKEEGKA